MFCNVHKTKINSQSASSFLCFALASCARLTTTSDPVAAPRLGQRAARLKTTSDPVTAAQAGPEGGARLTSPPPRPGRREEGALRPRATPPPLHRSGQRAACLSRPRATPPPPPRPGRRTALHPQALGRPQHTTAHDAHARARRRTRARTHRHTHTNTHKHGASGPGTDRRVRRCGARVRARHSAEQRGALV